MGDTRIPLGGGGRQGGGRGGGGAEAWGRWRWRWRGRGKGRGRWQSLSDPKHLPLNPWPSLHTTLATAQHLPTDCCRTGEEVGGGGGGVGEHRVFHPNVIGLTWITRDRRDLA